MKAIYYISLLFGLIFFKNLAEADALQCYECGIRDDKSDACETSGGPTFVRIVECPKHGYCSKTNSRDQNGEVKIETTRGCADRVTVSGRKHHLGCSIDQRSGAVICHCNENMCNRATKDSFNFFIFISIMFFAHYLKTNY